VKLLTAFPLEKNQQKKIEEIQPVKFMALNVVFLITLT